MIGERLFVGMMRERSHICWMMSDRLSVGIMGDRIFVGMMSDRLSVEMMGERSLQGLLSMFLLHYLQGVQV
ncbi:hypothetical protein [Dolichospermum sp. UHCC 0315A]|uniref:hypothetical protein n=1 Tax=Dolichospermum sp. UHCC 0315A TaxID=1914871 RepID=UPI0011E72FD1|nr:hypothetical protein [Dolichospermum sp. UHCC 0315A]